MLDLALMKVPTCIIEMNAMAHAFANWNREVTEG